MEKSWLSVLMVVHAIVSSCLFWLWYHHQMVHHRAAYPLALRLFWEGPPACISTVIDWYNFFSGIPVVAILAAIPWLLPWDEITVPYLPIFHVVSSITPWIGSTLYHLFMNHNTGYIAYKVLLTIDMLGIWVTQTAGMHLSISGSIALSKTILIRYSIILIQTIHSCLINDW